MSGWTKLLSTPTRFPRLGIFSLCSPKLKPISVDCAIQFNPVCAIFSDTPRLNFNPTLHRPWWEYSDLRRPLQPQHAMNGTPRLTSAFPQTPQTLPRRRKLFETPSRSQPRDGREVKSPARPSVNAPKQPQPQPQTATPPLVPVNLIDAPSQRLYVVAVYLALNALRVYESWTASDELDSTWLFLKWISFDGIFLFGLQALRIPWLEWAFPTTLAVFLVHIVGNIFLMFRIPVRSSLPSRLKFILTVLDTFRFVVFRIDQGCV